MMMNWYGKGGGRRFRTVIDQRDVEQRVTNCR